MRRLVFTLLSSLIAAVLATVAPVTPAAATGDDTVLAFGDATFGGSTSAMPLNAPLVGFAANAGPAGGYWLLAKDGGVFAFGGAAFHGSTGNLRLNKPVVAMSATPTGRGYWLVAEDGGVFTFGDARFHGSTGAIKLAQPIVGIASTLTGAGYWLVAADGGVFTFGDAAYYGSAAPHRPAKAVVGLAPTPTGLGYWIAAGDGSVYSFGDAPYHGNAAGHEYVTAIAAAPDGNGYWLAGRDGGVYAHGSAAFAGSASGVLTADRETFAIAPTRTGRGYVLAARATPPLPAAIQQRLDALGYWVPVDGRAGPLLTQALYALQKAAGIPRTGVFDAATQRALDAGTLPTPRTTTGYAVEVDKAHQLVMLVSNGRVVRVFNTSTGSGKRYRSGSGYAIANTPEGSFRVYTQINALRISELGELWRPKYFTGGFALHGSPSIPPYPASHGCVRLSNAAINWMWDTNAVPLGTPVQVYS